MRYITKGREPSSLTQYKKQSGAYFDGVNKEDIRQALLEEQGYLCAYCMRRISAENMKIDIGNHKANIKQKNWIIPICWVYAMEMQDMYKEIPRVIHIGVIVH